MSWNITSQFRSILSDEHTKSIEYINMKDLRYQDNVIKHTKFIKMK